MAGLIGALSFPFRASGDVDELFKEVVRPPGSVTGATGRALQCDQCIRVCPTNAAAGGVGGRYRGRLTPIMNMRTGYCELNCTLCGEVFPTAIQKI